MTTHLLHWSHLQYLLERSLTIELRPRPISHSTRIFFSFLIQSILLHKLPLCLSRLRLHSFIFIHGICIFWLYSINHAAIILLCVYCLIILRRNMLNLCFSRLENVILPAVPCWPLSEHTSLLHSAVWLGGGISVGYTDSLQRVQRLGLSLLDLVPTLEACCSSHYLSVISCLTLPVSPLYLRLWWSLTLWPDESTSACCSVWLMTEIHHAAHSAMQWQPASHGSFNGMPALESYCAGAKTLPLARCAGGTAHGAAHLCGGWEELAIHQRNSLLYSINARRPRESA